MEKKIISVVTGLALLAFGASYAMGKGTNIKNIPNGTQYNCKTCHKPGGYKVENLNSFGKDYLGNKSKWDEKLAKADSDRDGFTNGQELCDPEGKWKNGDADPAGDVYNPGDASSHK